MQYRPQWDKVMRQSAYSLASVGSRLIVYLALRPTSSNTT